MTEKRNITREDVLLKLKLQIQGAGVEVKQPLAPTPWGSRVILDDTDMVLPLLTMLPNPSAGLQVVIDDNHVSISEMGEVLATGRLEERPGWLDVLMSDGVTHVGEVFNSNMPSECLILFGDGCFARDSRKTCSYCGFAQVYPRAVSLSKTRQLQARPIEAIALAAKNGWRGLVMIVGGLLPPRLRGQWYTDNIEATMTRFRELLDDEDILSELQITVDNAPPDDLGEYHKWKSFGVNSIEIDTEVLHPDWFKAICPAKDKVRWNEAQEAAAGVFGRGRGSSNLFVLGVEPMAGMLEGVEERVSKGVYVMPSSFFPYPGSPMEGMGSPSLEWFREAHEKIVDIYFKYANTFDIDLTEDDRWGYTRRTRSLWPYDDEWIRRLQEMGKLPPGLPNQYGVDAA